MKITHILLLFLLPCLLPAQTEKGSIFGNTYHNFRYRWISPPQTEGINADSRQQFDFSLGYFLANDFAIGGTVHFNTTKKFSDFLAVISEINDERGATFFTRYFTSIRPNYKKLKASIYVEVEWWRFRNERENLGGGVIEDNVKRIRGRTGLDLHFFLSPELAIEGGLYYRFFQRLQDRPNNTYTVFSTQKVFFENRIRFYFNRNGAGIFRRGSQAGNLLKKRKMLLGGFANIGPITNRNGVILDGNMRFGKFILPKLAFGATAEWEVLIDGWFIFQHDYGLFLRYYAPIAPTTQILVELNPTIFFSGLGEFRKRSKSFTTNPDFNVFTGLGLHRFLTTKIGVEFLAGFYWFNNLDGLREGEQVEKAYGIETKAGIHYYF